MYYFYKHVYYVIHDTARQLVDILFSLSSYLNKGGTHCFVSVVLITVLKHCKHQVKGFELFLSPASFIFDSQVLTIFSLKCLLNSFPSSTLYSCNSHLDCLEYSINCYNFRLISLLYPSSIHVPSYISQQLPPFLIPSTAPECLE
jgi:hypothetical protein